MNLSLPTGAVLVTGSTGFLGTYLMKILSNHGLRTIGLDLAPVRNDSSTMQLDIRDRAQLMGKLRPFTVSHIVHLAALHIIPQCEADPEETMETNVQGTANMLYVADRLGVETFTLASSADVYLPSDRPHMESDPLGSPSVYGRSKAAAEQIVRDWATGGKCATVARLFNLVGREDPNPHLVPQLLQQLNESIVVRAGRMDTVRDYVLVDDVAHLLSRLSSCPGTLTVNVGNGVGYSGTEVLDELGSVLGRPYTLVPDATRVRTNDRPTLVADRSKLDGLVSFPSRSLRSLMMASAGRYAGLEAMRSPRAHS